MNSYKEMREAFGPGYQIPVVFEYHIREKLWSERCLPAHRGA